MNGKDIINLIKQKFPKAKFAAIAAVAGLLLIMFPFSSFGGDDQPKTTDSRYSEGFDVDELERKIKKILSVCDGVGRVDVVLTIKAGAENVYEHDVSQNIKKQDGEDGASQSNSEQTRTLVLTRDSTYGESPVIVRQNYPQLMGAVIVCDGGGNDRVRLKVLEAVKALTGISADNISIIKMKSN